jgi:hypothetical protein
MRQIVVNKESKNKQKTPLKEVTSSQTKAKAMLTQANPMRNRPQIRFNKMMEASP